MARLGAGGFRRVPVSGAGHEDGDVVGRVGGQGGQQGVARFGDGQQADGLQGAGQARHAGADAGGGVFDEPVGVQDQGAAGGQGQPGGLVAGVAEAGAERQAGGQGGKTVLEPGQATAGRGCPARAMSQVPAWGSWTA